MSSMAEYLTTSPDETVFEIVFSVISSTIFAIAKSQISGSPLPAYGQPVVLRLGVRTWNLPRERSAHFSTPLQSIDFYRGIENSRISLWK